MAAPVLVPGTHVVSLEVGARSSPSPLGACSESRTIRIVLVAVDTMSLVKTCDPSARGYGRQQWKIRESQFRIACVAEMSIGEVPVQHLDAPPSSLQIDGASLVEPLTYTRRGQEYTMLITRKANLRTQP
jgi:hypothetical protein